MHGSSHAEAHFYQQSTERLIQAVFDVLRVDVTSDLPSSSCVISGQYRLTVFAPVVDQEPLSRYKSLLSHSHEGT
jgi:dTMP kinase